MIRIHGSVGREGLNAYKDVVTVQSLINDCLHVLAPLQKLETDESAGGLSHGASINLVIVEGRSTTAAPRATSAIQAVGVQPV